MIKTTKRWKFEILGQTNLIFRTKRRSVGKKEKTVLDIKMSGNLVHSFERKGSWYFLDCQSLNKYIIKLGGRDKTFILFKIKFLFHYNSNLIISFRRKKYIKYLGVIVDNNLNWKQHKLMNELSKKFHKGSPSCLDLVILFLQRHLFTRAGMVGAVFKISAFWPEGPQFDPSPIRDLNICATFFPAILPR